MKKFAIVKIPFPTNPKVRKIGEELKVKLILTRLLCDHIEEDLERLESLDGNVYHNVGKLVFEASGILETASNLSLDALVKR